MYRLSIQCFNQCESSVTAMQSQISKILDLSLNSVGFVTVTRADSQSNPTIIPSSLQDELISVFP